MNPLLKKLNCKTQQSVVVLHAPKGFNDQITDFQMFLNVKTNIDNDDIEFALAFCTKLEEVEKYARAIDEKIVDDGLFWFAYPKKSSKKYSCEFNRDNGWDIMGALGYEPVRMVAIDEDWSALRFRKATHIKTLKRDPSWIKSEEGKKKALKNKK